MTGDAEDKAEKTFAEKLEDVDIYYVGHHGSETSSSQSLLNKIKPEICIISSVGPSGQYKNPNWNVLERLLAFTPDIYATYMSGNIIITIDKGNISVSAGEGDRLTLDNYGGVKGGEEKNVGV